MKTGIDASQHLTLRQIEAFCRVVELGSFSEAARRMFVSQPVVSQHVRSLESALGVRLFRRRGARTALTPEGQILYRACCEVLERVGDLLAASRSLRAASGPLVIGVAASVCNYVLGPILARFKGEGCGGPIRVEAMNTGRVYGEVLTGRVDAGITMDWRVPQGLVTEPLFCEDVVLVGPGNRNPLESGAARDGRDFLAGLRFIMPPRHTSLLRELVDARLQEWGIRLPVDLEIGEPESIKQAVQAGLGWTFIPASFVSRDLREGRLCRVDLPGWVLEARYVVAYRGAEAVPPLLPELVAYARRELGRAGYRCAS